MADLLLEIYSEEIPARMQVAAEEQLLGAVTAKLKEAGLAPESAESFSTPRRIGFYMSGLPKEQPDVSEERKGPRVGAPERAVEGFLRSAGLESLDQCETREDKKGEYYVAVIEKKGGATADVIAGFMPEVIRTFHWPKSMRWGTGSLRWVRPIHSILCTLDGKTVEFEVGGYKSGDVTHGHLFHSPGEIKAPTFDKYKDRLREAHVILDRVERKDIIWNEATHFAEGSQLDVERDDALLEEVAGLVEWPMALMGTFDEAFLEVPEEVLVTAMRSHQKYFALRDPKTGKLANRFIFVTNLEPDDGGSAIIAGNERVLRARLSDAKFFWDQDRKQSLESRVEKLKDIVFYDKLGTVYDKVQRVKALQVHVAPKVEASPKAAEQAVLVCKADLVTDMVYEFPELQGVMGRYYALEEELDPNIADAIRDHYAPQGPGDECPSAPVSVAVAMADKIDTLVGFWSCDQKPTGSRDPYALRRAALGVIRLVLENDLRVRLLDFFSVSLLKITESGFGGVADNRTVGPDLLSFFADRLKIYLRDKGARHDLIDAVFALPKQDDLVAIVARVEALGAFLDTDDGQNLLAGYKRAANILRIEEKKDKKSYDAKPAKKVMTEAAEKDLADAIAETNNAVEAALAKEDFTAAMGAVAHLRAPVDRFFDEVTVNDKDKKVRANRLNLLNQIRASLEGVADFSKIEG
jgi:glycyl-tRNA synthetase beta chain